MGSSASSFTGTSTGSPPTARRILVGTLGPLTTKVVNTLVGLAGVIIILDHFLGINIGSLLSSLGVGSLKPSPSRRRTRLPI
ncbi:MAG: hypothetical protein MZV64_29555 [Ignavibacteriales bacterium]|nr:hypothetical protein [Ignavibacteriales bacterium]